MQTQIETNDNEKSPMLERVNNLSPKFASNKDALEFYSRRLEAIALNVNLNIKDLLDLAEKSNIHNEDYIEALYCAKKIDFLKR